MGVELELYVLLILLTLGSSIFAVFEVETPPWRKTWKWSCGSGNVRSTQGIAERGGRRRTQERAGHRGSVS